MVTSEKKHPVCFSFSPGNEFENGCSGPTPPPMLPKKSASVSHMAGMMGKQMQGQNQDHYEHYIAVMMGQNRCQGPRFKSLFRPPLYITLTKEM